jgi:hypothetical protein
MADRQKVRALNDRASSNPVRDSSGVAPTQPTSQSVDTGDNPDDFAWVHSEQEDLPPASRFGWLLPVLAVLALIGWSGFYGWAMQATLAEAVAAPRLWAGLIAEWAGPVLLIGIGWLVVTRHSQAAAHRFARSAALLREESTTLEERLKVVNRELSLAREFLASQSRELDSLGRIATERLSQHAGELQALIQHNGDQVSALASTSETALGNMNLLRDNLPVVTNSVRDAANQIGNAGRTAQGQVEQLVAAFERLNQFGAASETQVTRLETRVGESLDNFAGQITQIEDSVTQRFGQLQSDADTYREQVDALETSALSALGERVRDAAAQVDALAERLKQSDEEARERFKETFAQLHDELVEKLRLVDEIDRATGTAAEQRTKRLTLDMETLSNQIDARARHFDEQIELRQAAFATHEAQASEVLAQRLAELDDALAQRRETQIDETEKLVAHGSAAAAQLERLGDLLAQINAASADVKSELGAGMNDLAEKLLTNREVIAVTGDELADLTKAGIRLLEIIQSGNRYTREDLTSGIAAATERLELVENKASAVHGLMLEGAEQGEKLEAYLIRTRSEILAADAAIRELEKALGEQTDDAMARLQGLRSGFARLAEESGALATDSQDQLRTSLDEIDSAISASFTLLENGARERLGELAQSLGSDAVAALERALRNESAVTIGKLEQAAFHASGVGREATVQLRDSLAMVNELTGNLEQRIAHAHEQAEEQVNNDFARRMALITESLNSAAIDIGGALANEVSDTAWEAYLKGDRGIFTRRAIRLIDNGTARNIADLYQQDDTFKGNVSRYIHDFEAMLRSILSTRNGNVLSVTMLGSDMGKLYVALAQAIKRFRD